MVSDLTHAPIVASGQAVGEGVVTGVARFVASARDLDKLQPGEILMAESTGPDWEPAMALASAIVTNSGGASSHAARTAQAAGRPAVVGTVDGASRRWTGALITVQCAGRTGVVFEGSLKGEVDQPPAGPASIGW